MPWHHQCHRPTATHTRQACWLFGAWALGSRQGRCQEPADSASARCPRHQTLCLTCQAQLRPSSMGSSQPHLLMAYGTFSGAYLVKCPNCPNIGPAATHAAAADSRKWRQSRCISVPICLHRPSHSDLQAWPQRLLMLVPAAAQRCCSGKHFLKGPGKNSAPWPHSRHCKPHDASFLQEYLRSHWHARSAHHAPCSVAPFCSCKRPWTPATGPWAGWKSLRGQRIECCHHDIAAQAG